MFPLITIIREHKSRGETRSQTDYWFPIIKPQTKFSHVDRHGKMKSKQIPFSEVLDLTYEETSKVLKKLADLREKHQPFPFQFPLTMIKKLSGFSWMRVVMKKSSKRSNQHNNPTKLGNFLDGF